MQLADVADVLWITCLPLTSFAVPFFPLASGLRQWAADQGVALPAVLTGADKRPMGNGRSFDAWLDVACQRRPMVLVVDDLHWADQSSLDVLMYVLAGPAGRGGGRHHLRAGEEGKAIPCAGGWPTCAGCREWASCLGPAGSGGHRGTAGRLVGGPAAPVTGRRRVRPHPGQRLPDHPAGSGFAVRTRGPLPAGLPTDLRRRWPTPGTAVIASASADPPGRRRRPTAARGPARRGRRRASGSRGDPVPLLREAVDAAVLEVGDRPALLVRAPAAGRGARGRAVARGARRPGMPRLRQRWNRPPPRK